MSKPDLLYRLSRDQQTLYLRVPDDDTENDIVLMFNRVMADLGFPDPKLIFKDRLGVAVVPRKRSYRDIRDSRLKIVYLDLFAELSKLFTMLQISDIDWHTKRF